MNRSSFLLYFVFAVAASVLFGCATQNTSTMRGREVQVRYAEVIAVERVQMPSAAVPAGAIVGGFTGIMLSRHASTAGRIGATAGGAALGGLAGKALEGDRKGYGYRLRFGDGSESRFITEKGYLRTGDCVAVERSQYDNIRRVPESLCEPRPERRANSVHREQAEQCLRAKEQLLDALTEEEMGAAARKVEILCQF